MPSTRGALCEHWFLKPRKPSLQITVQVNIYLTKLARAPPLWSIWHCNQLVAIAGQHKQRLLPSLLDAGPFPRVSSLPSTLHSREATLQLGSPSLGVGGGGLEGWLSGGSSSGGPAESLEGKGKTASPLAAVFPARKDFKTIAVQGSSAAAWTTLPLRCVP